MRVRVSVRAPFSVLKLGAIVPLPTELVDEIRQICFSQEVDADESVRGVESLVGVDACQAYSVWGGPAYGNESVKLDVYVVGTLALYNYTAIDGGAVQRHSVFLDALSNISLHDVTDARSPHILAFWTHEEVGRIFGGPQDLHRLEKLMKAIVVARSNRS